MSLLTSAMAAITAGRTLTPPGHAPRIGKKPARRRTGGGAIAAVAASATAAAAIGLNFGAKQSYGQLSGAAFILTSLQYETLALSEHLSYPIYSTNQFPDMSQAPSPPNTRSDLSAHRLEEEEAAPAALLLRPLLSSPRRARLSPPQRAASPPSA